MNWRAGRAACLLMLLSTSLAAQQSVASDDLALRGEYAHVLLNAQRWDEAAAEFRWLLARAPNDHAHRLGLARALAWSGRGREAETELLQLPHDARTRRDVVELMRVARGAFDPTAEEARRWVSEDPQHLPYRLAWARALVRENRTREALPLYDSLVRRDPSDALLREAASAYASAGDARGAAHLLMRALLRTPGDTALRREYARVLSWGKEYRRAIVEFDRLITTRPTDAALLLERARVYLALNDTDRAMRDINAALALGENAETLALRGDLWRWRGEWELARADYQRALALGGDRSLLTTSLAMVDREERASLAPVWDEIGTVGTVTYAEDNAGYLFLAAGGRYAFPYETMVASVGVEQRRVAHRAFGEEERYVYGWVADAGLSTILGATYVGGRIGAARHGLVGTMLTGEARIASPLGPAFVSASVRRAPAYETLRTAAALVRATGAEVFATPSLSLDAVTASVSVPFEDVMLGVSGEHLRVSDGNRRTGFNLDARWALAEELYAVYAGGVLGYDGRSELYWDPEHYSSHLFGIEYRRDTRGPLSLAARVLPGLARSRESPAVADSLLRFPARYVAQLSASGEVAWRARTWSVALNGAYGRGREGGYQSLSGGARVRVEW